jgi:hypothetical protein
MKHIGWKIIFGVSWIPGIFLYSNLINCLTSMGKSGTEGLAGGIGFFVLLIPTILFLGLQVALGYLAFRR